MGKEKPMAAGEPVRWGILGTGRINRKLIGGARESTRAQVIAVASRDRARAEAHAAEHGIPRVFGSYEELLADPEIEAVYVSLPNALHHEWTMRALAAGKHVLCEKPYSRRPDAVVEAFEAAERAGLILSEGFMWRHGPQTMRLLEELPRIGRLETVRASFSFRLDDERNVRMRPELDGGALMDVGCYCINGVRLLAGEEPERVYGEMVTGSTGVDVRVVGTLRFSSGVVAELSCGFTTEHMGLEAIGTAGSIFLPDPWHGRAGLLTVNGEEILVDPGNLYRLELDNVGAAIRGEAPVLLGRDDALGQARTIEALYRSAATGVSVTL